MEDSEDSTDPSTPLRLDTDDTATDDRRLGANEKPTKDDAKKQETDAPSSVGEGPDGGYGWVIVFASFTMGLIVDGCLFTFGIMTMEFVEFFQTNKMTIALAGSVMNGVYLSVGPLVSGCCNKFGCQTTACVGSVVAALGFVTCIFSPNVVVLVLTYGALAGFGFGMMHLPSIVMVGFYFTKKRAFATGLAMCGSGIGAFIFAPIIQQLLRVYEWRGAQLILAGIVLQGCIMALLFRPLTTKHRKTKHNAEKTNYDEPICYGKNDTDHLSVEDNSRQLRLRTPSDSNDVGSNLRKDIFYSGSLISIPEHTSREINRKKRLNENRSGRNCCRKFVAFFDFSLLKSPAFDLYGLSCFLTMAGFFIPFMFLPDLAVSQGVSRDGAALLLSIIGIANTVGRVICGWVSDQPWADCLVVNICALVMGGVALALVPAFRYTYWLLAVSAALFGLSIAVFASLRSIIMVELMGLERLTNAFGLVTMFQGLSTFIGNPVAGGIYDATGQYDVLFYFAGSLLILAGLACIPCRRLAINGARTISLDVENL